MFLAVTRAMVLLCAAGLGLTAQISFLYPTTIRVEGNITSIVGGDFNNDGLGDFAVTFGTAGAAVFLSNGDGTFSRKDLAVPAGRAFVAAADIAGAHKLGLIGRSFCILGNGDGTFKPFIQSGAIAGVGAVADFNGDGVPDVVGIDDTKSSFSVQFGRGDGTFGSPVFVDEFAGIDHGFYPYVATGDLNGDGFPDIIWNSDVGGAGPEVWLNNGDGTFRSADSTVAFGNFAFNRSFVVGDVNGDGKSDLVYLNGTSVVLFNGKGNGALEMGTRYLSQPPGVIASSFQLAGQIVLADFDGDGKLDVSTAYYVLRGNGDGTLRPGLGFGQVNPWPNTFGTPSSVVIQDVNGDGKPDMLAIGPAQNMISILINSSGTPVASAPAYLAVPNGGPIPEPFLPTTAGVNLAPGALAVLYGEGLSTTIASAAPPLPKTIGNTSVELVDFAGKTFLAPLLYVSPTQINFQVPDAAAPGLAIINVLGTGRPRGAHSTLILPASPGLFTVDGSGNGAPVASAVSVAPDGTQTVIGTNPLTLPATGQVYLSLYGTGFRYATPANCAGVASTYAGPQGPDSPVDQVNIPIPLNWPKGSRDIACSFPGYASNTVTITIK